MQLLASEEYGLRCLLRVAAREHAGPVPISAIARAEGLTPEYTAKLMRQLRLGRLVTSVHGAGGGYRLSRPAESIDVWGVLQALGGPLFPDGFCACFPGRRRECVRTADCSLRPLWRALQEALRRTLEGVSLRDLERDERAMSSWIGRGCPAESPRATAAAGALEASGGAGAAPTTLQEGS